MKNIIRGRWVIFAIWLVITIVLTVFEPNINTILRFRGQSGLSSNSPSVVSDAMLSKMSVAKGNDDLIVFYDKAKLSESDMKEIKAAVNNIGDIKANLGITNIIDPFSMPDAKSSLISKDGTTLMVSFKLNQGTRKIDDIEKQLDSKLSNVKAEHYLSGTDFINNDYLKASESGVEKSAALTVVFILLVLIIMFRSVVTPIISLLAVAFSYLCSIGIVAQLIDKAGFPVTSLTQMLLVLILFGIGTDYNILLFNRFKEELGKGLAIDEAIIETYKTAGKTIAFSILTVFIAFLALIFAKSPIYRSGVAVAIGVTVLLVEILTLTPFIMKLLGSRLFWPSKKIEAHGENKFWGKASSFAAKKPIVSIIIVILIIAPTVYFHQEKLNFNTVGELGNSEPSSKGFNIVSEHFGKGQAMPSTIVIENDKSMDNNSDLAVIDNITEKVKNIKGVKEVSSVTEPEGKEISDFYISNEMGAVTDGLSKTQGGVNQIADGLKEASDKLGSADFSKVDEMVSGTAQLQSGVTALSNGLSQIQTGISGGSSGSQNIDNGIKTIESNLKTMSSSINTLQENYSKMQAGYKEMGTSYQQSANALLGVKSALTQMQYLVSALGTSYKGSASDMNYLELKGTIDQLTASLNQVTPEGINELNTNYNALTGGFESANSGLSQMSSGLSQMADGLNQLEGGISKASSGIGTIVTNMNSISTGLSQMEAGQQQLATGLKGLNTFGSKLSDVNNGLKQISDGIGKTNNFLSELNGSKTFFIPNEALNNSDFKKALDNFMSKDRKITKLIVILKDDPYSTSGMNTVEEIKTTVSGTLNGSVLKNAKSGVSGPTAMTNDMNNILSGDLNRATIIVIIGVFLVLLLVIRSFFEPIVITASLMSSYYGAMFIINYIFINVKGYEGISSFVPFFAFIIIIALGVDYSIFLMMRFKEYPHMDHKEAIVLASKHTGGIVMSAAIILGGTFATLIPSGMLLLFELAVAVISGLVILCFIMLPIFLPAMISAAKLVTSKEVKK